MLGRGLVTSRGARIVVALLQTRPRAVRTGPPSLSNSRLWTRLSLHAARVRRCWGRLAVTSVDRGRGSALRSRLRMLRGW